MKASGDTTRPNIDGPALCFSPEAALVHLNLPLLSAGQRHAVSPNWPVLSITQASPALHGAGGANHLLSARTGCNSVPSTTLRTKWDIPTDALNPAFKLVPGETFFNPSGYVLVLASSSLCRLSRASFFARVVGRVIGQVFGSAA